MNGDLTCYLPLFFMRSDYFLLQAEHLLYLENSEMHTVCLLCVYTCLGRMLTSVMRVTVFQEAVGDVVDL